MHQVNLKPPQLISPMVLTKQNLPKAYMLLLLSLLHGVLVSYASRGDDNVSCLKSLRASFEDPENRLETWDFTNTSKGFICNFDGIECWHDYENRVLNIRLSGYELRGQIPRGLNSCTSITGLDLSNNTLSGPIPFGTLGELRFLTALDLSNNNFSGPISPKIADLSYLNVLRLDNNHLKGTIPREIGFMYRLREFNVSSNDLTGPVPTFIINPPTSDAFANNRGLCGFPLKACKSVHSKRDVPYAMIISGFFSGWTISYIWTVYVFFYGIPCVHAESINMKLAHLWNRYQRRKRRRRRLRQRQKRMGH